MKRRGTDPSLSPLELKGRCTDTGSAQTSGRSKCLLRSRTQHKPKAQRCRSYFLKVGRGSGQAAFNQGLLHKGKRTSPFLPCLCIYTEPKTVFNVLHEFWFCWIQIRPLGLNQSFGKPSHPAEEASYLRKGNLHPCPKSDTDLKQCENYFLSAKRSFQSIRSLIVDYYYY